MRRSVRRLTGDQRISSPCVVGKGTTGGINRRHVRRVPHIPTFGVRPFRHEQIRTGLDGRARDVFKRIGSDFGRADILVYDLVHERRIRPVFQQTAHKIGQQIAMRANRCIDTAARAIARFYDVVQCLAHSVKALEFKGFQIIRHV